MRKLTTFTLLLLSVAFIISNCTKEGPEGPVGAQGPQGPAGANGGTGPAGSANVIYSAWFTPDQNGGWADTTINGVVLQKKFRKAAPGVTLAMLNNGVILSYVKLTPDGAGGTTTSIRQLPYANPGTATEYFPLHYVGNITYAQASTANPGVAVAASSGSLEFRYVLIPGGVSGGRMTSGAATGYSVDQLRNMSYEQAVSLFNIPANGSNE